MKKETTEDADRATRTRSFGFIGSGEDEDVERASSLSFSLSLSPCRACEPEASRLTGANADVWGAVESDAAVEDVGACVCEPA